MNPNLGRPAITPEIVARFAAYYRECGAWGSLHVVLDNGNYAAGFVDEESAAEAEAFGDHEGAALIRILGTMTRSQRARIGRRAERWDRAHRGASLAPPGGP